MLRQKFQTKSKRYLLHTVCNVLKRRTEVFDDEILEATVDRQ